MDTQRGGRCKIELEDSSCSVFPSSEVQNFGKSKTCCSWFRTKSVYSKVFFWSGTPPPFVYLVDTISVITVDQAFPTMFACCKQSKTVVGYSQNDLNIGVKAPSPLQTHSLHTSRHSQISSLMLRCLIGNNTLHTV